MIKIKCIYIITHYRIVFSISIDVGVLIITVVIVSVYILIKSKHRLVNCEYHDVFTKYIHDCI